MIKHESGAITVYLCIIFAAMIIVTGVLTDIARIRTAEIQVERAVESAVSSTLSGYDRTLKDNFGLFVLNNNNVEHIKNIINEYTASNLGIKHYNGFLDLYDYKIESLKVTPMYNLTENPVMRRQIVEYMKYRAPKQVVESFIGKAKAMADTAKIVELSDMKMQIDKVFMDIINDVRNIDKAGKEINKFIYKDFENLLKEYVQLTREFRMCKKKVEEIRKNLSQARAAKESIAKAARIASLLGKLYKAMNQESNARKQKEKAFSKIDEYLNNFLKLNNDALTYCMRLSGNAADISGRVSSIKKYIDDNINDKSSEYLKNLANEIIRGTNLENRKTCINEIESQIPEREAVNELSRKVSLNLGLIELVSKEIEIFNQKYGTSIDNGNPSESLDRYIFPKVLGLKDYKADISIKKINPPFNGTKGTDPRKAAKNDAKKKLMYGKDKKKNAIKENQKELPSYKKIGRYINKVESPDFSDKDDEYKKIYEGFIKSKTSKESGMTESKTDFSFSNIEKEIDFGNNDFSQKAFGIVEEMGKWFDRIIADGLLAYRDELYVDEYIIGMFSSAVPELKNGTNTRKDLRGRQKQNTVDCETEYILCGNTSNNFNVNFVKGQILLIRFAIDTVNVYRNPEKVEAAVAIASAASFWSFGLSEPVIQNLILCGWGMLDAVNDLDRLMEGEVVPAFKKFEKTDSGKQQLGFSYHDYLRIFLLLQNSDEKMNRIEDLIQLKSGKKLSGYNSYIRIEVDVSIKYIFITRAFMPASLKTKEGSRHNLKVVLYQGY